MVYEGVVNIWKLNMFAIGLHFICLFFILQADEKGGEKMFVVCV